MDNDELASLLEKLEQGLIEAGLSSLVEQERVSAVEGKVEELTPRDVAGLRREWSSRRTGEAPRIKAGDVRVRALGVGERLAELLDLVEVAVGGTYAIEARLRDDLGVALDDSAHVWSGQVVFADPPESELSGTLHREWTLSDQSALRQRGTAVRDILLTINQLRDQAELPRGEWLVGVEVPETRIGSADLASPEDWS